MVIGNKRVAIFCALLVIKESQSWKVKVSVEPKSEASGNCLLSDIGVFLSNSALLKIGRIDLGGGDRT